jgi:hypothetical protein
MQATRFVLMLLVVLAVGAVAEAQCLTCQAAPGPRPPSTGTCGESFEGYCDRTCCGASIGDPCPIPDWSEICGWWLVKKADANRPLLHRAIKRNEPAFTSRLLLERNATSAHRRLSRCSA